MVVSKVKFVNLNEKEEAACIETITYMKYNLFKTYFVVPILSILSLFFFSMYLYWEIEAQAKWFYDEVEKITDASHVLLTGKDSNIEICELEN